MLGLVLTSTAEGHTLPKHPDHFPSHMLIKIHHQRDMVHYYQGKMGNPLTRYRYWAERRCGNLSCRYQILRIWNRRHHHWKYLWEHIGTAATTSGYYDPKYAGLRCIHTHEGAWNAYNPAGPYYGGLQMDSAFMSSWGSDMLSKYGGRDARYWSPLDQLIVGYRAVVSIGYGPWPNTRLMCGI